MYPTPNTQHPTPNTQHPTPNLPVLPWLLTLLAGIASLGLQAKNALDFRCTYAPGGSEVAHSTFSRAHAHAPVDLNCAFLVATTATSPSWKICLQAEEQSAAFLHIWTITDAAGNSWSSNDPDFCQQWAGNPGLITVEHIIIDPVTSLFESCTREVEIYPPVNGKSCPNYNPIVNVESSNDCTLETSIYLDLTDIGIPFTVSFGDGTPAISASASPIVHQYPWGGTFELALTYNPPLISDSAVLSTCRYNITVNAPPNCSGDCLPDRISVETSGPCPWENVLLHFDLPINIFPLQVQFGDGTSGTITSPTTVHSFPAAGTYVITYAYTTPQGNINTCYETVIIPDCCHNPGFTFEEYPVSSSCLNPQYILYPYCDQTGVTHRWIFSDSTVFEGSIPPPHLFTNFLDEQGEVCVIHELTCCDVTYSDTMCLPHPEGAYIGKPNTLTRLSDILPFTGGTVLEFIQAHMNNPDYPLFVEGTLIADIDAEFGAGTWNMGRDAVVLVSGEPCGIVEQSPSFRFFALRSTILQSAASLDPTMYGGCCNWQGIKSADATFITLDGAAIRECQIGLHYLAPRSSDCFPYAYIRNTTFYSNIFGIKSEGQYVHFLTPFPFFFQGFTNNKFFGAPQDAICTCNAENAIDFRNVHPASLTIQLVNGLSADPWQNEIARYEQGLHFENTSLEARGFYIHDLGNFAPPNDPPSLYDPEAGFGIWYRWDKSVPSRLWIDNFRFKNFYVNQGPAIAVYDAVYKGKHDLKATATPPNTAIQTDNLAGGYKLEVGPLVTFNGEISENDITTDGAHEFGFGILGNLASPNVSLHITGNTFSVNSDPLISSMNGGIILGSPEEIPADLIITDNLIQVNQTNGAGIALTNLKNYIVRRNDIIGGSSDIPGIRLSKGGFGVVDCNTIQDKYIGILAEAVPDNRYGVNSLYANFRDMEFKGDNFGTTGSELAWNIFSHSADYSIYFHYGTLIGNQYHTRFNNWFGQTWTNGMLDPDVFAFQPASGKKFYHPAGEPTGSVHHPNSDPPGLFTQTTMPEEPVPLGFCLADSDELVPKDELPEARQQWEWVAADSLGADLAPPLRIFLHQRAYRQVLAHPEWTAESPELAAFFSEAQQSFTGRSETLRQHWREWTDSVSASRAQMNGLFDQADALVSGIQAWALQAVTADSLAADSLYSLVHIGMLKLQGIESALAEMDSTLSHELFAQLKQLQQENDLLESVETWQWAEKRYNEIALNWSNGAGPDSADLADLRTIASLCLDQGGRAVLDARALCAVWLHEFYADNEACTQSFAASRPWSFPSEPQPDLRLGPNPVDDLLHLQLPDTDSPEEPCMLEIVSADGRVLYRRQFTGKAGPLRIATGQWPDGLYFVRLVRPSKTLVRAFAVQH